MRTPLPAYLKVCICHCHLAFVKGRRALVWRTNGKRQVDAHIYHLHIWSSGRSVGEGCGGPSSPLIFLRLPPSHISGSGWLGPPLFEGLDLPLCGYTFLHLQWYPPYDQLIYPATLLLWPRSFEPNVNYKKHFVLLFWRPASLGHLLTGPTVVTLSPGSTVLCTELYFL